MKGTLRWMRLAAILGVGAGLSGCGGGDPRTSNQGGGSLVTAGLKITSNRISALTPDEIQILGDVAQSRNPDMPALTDEEAALIQEFLAANRINSLDDITKLIAQLQADPASVFLPDGFLEAFFGVSAGTAEA